jgi:hypothetical protein
MAKAEAHHTRWRNRCHASRTRNLKPAPIQRRPIRGPIKIFFWIGHAFPEKKGEPPSDDGSPHAFTLVLHAHDAHLAPRLALRWCEMLMDEFRELG